MFGHWARSSAAPWPNERSEEVHIDTRELRGQELNITESISRATNSEGPLGRAYLGTRSHLPPISASACKRRLTALVASGVTRVVALVFGTGNA